MTGKGGKVWDFFHFGVLPRKAPPWNSRGAWNSPLRGRGRLPNWRKDLKILILFHSFLFNFRIQDGRGAVKENSLGSPGYRQKRSRTEFGAGPWWVFDMRVRLR